MKLSHTSIAVLSIFSLVFGISPVSFAFNVGENGNPANLVPSLLPNSSLIESAQPLITPPPFFQPIVTPSPSIEPIVSPTPSAQPIVTPNPNPQTGSITICKIFVDAAGNVIRDFPDETATPVTTLQNVPDGDGVYRFTITGFTPDPPTPFGDPVGELPETVFTLPLSLNTKILASSEENDAMCTTYYNLTLLNGGYYYGEENILPNITLFEAPRYNDQNDVIVTTLNDFFVYSPELFDDDLSNDGGRNTNSDGHIVLTPARPDRALILLNRLLPIPTPTPTPTVTPTPTPSAPQETVPSPSPIVTPTPDGGDDGDGNSGGDSGGGGGIWWYNWPGNFPPTPSPTPTPSVLGEVLGATTTTCGAYLDSYLRFGMQNDNVAKLQQFLNAYEGETLPVTGYFGPLTLAAVKRFQVKYWEEILEPWIPYGLSHAKAATGYVYKTTQRKINMIVCPELDLLMPELP